MEIADWKAYFAGKIASALIFVPSLFYTICDSLFHLDDLIINNKPEGLAIVRDLFFLTLSTASYIACNDLYHQALNESKNKAPAKSKDLQLEEIAEEENTKTDEKLDASYYFKLGNKANAKKDFKSAENYFMNAVELEPENAHNWYALAVARFNLGKYKLAKTNISEAIDLSDKRPEYYILAGKNYEQLGDKERAKKAFSLAKRLEESEK